MSVEASPGAFSTSFPLGGPGANFPKKLDNINKKLSLGVETKELEKKILKLINIIHNMESEHKARLAAETCCGISPKLWKWIGYGVSAASILPMITSGAAASTSAYYVADDDCSTPVPAIVLNVATAVSSLAVGGCTLLYQFLDSRRDAHYQELVSKLNSIRQVRLFIEAVKEFYSEKNEDNLQGCVTVLGQMPEETIVPKARDRWVSALVQVLPEESALKQRLEEQYRIAQELLKVTTESEEENASEEQTEPWEEEGTSNPGGEQVDIEMQPVPKKQADSDDESFLDTDHVVQLARSSDKPNKAELLRSYQQGFEDLKNEIGIGVQQLRYNDMKFDREGRIKKISSKA